MHMLLTLLLQLVAGLLLAPVIISAVPLGRAYHILYAVLLGALVWLSGLVIARVMGGAAAPGRATLVASIVGALVGVAVVLLPTFVPGTEDAIHLISEPLYLMAGALIGYWVLR